MHPASQDQLAPFTTVSRSRELLDQFVARAAAAGADQAPWIELSDTLTALERLANDARAATADWLAKAALCRVEHREDLAAEGRRRAAASEQEFAAYLNEIAAIWDFLENGAQEPLARPQDRVASRRFPAL